MPARNQCNSTEQMLQQNFLFKCVRACEWPSVQVAQILPIKQGGGGAGWGVGYQTEQSSSFTISLKT